MQSEQRLIAKLYEARRTNGREDPGVWRLRPWASIYGPRPTGRSLLRLAAAFFGRALRTV